MKCFLGPDLDPRVLQCEGEREGGPWCAEHARRILEEKVRCWLAGAEVLAEYGEMHADAAAQGVPRRQLNRRATWHNMVLPFLLVLTMMVYVVLYKEFGGFALGAFLGVCTAAVYVIYLFDRKYHSDTGTR